MKRHIKLLTCAFALVLLTTSFAAAKEISVRGRLARTVEANGWLIQTSAEKYLLLNAERFQNEAWFREATEVEATGETKPDVVTIYQEGIPFTASTLRQTNRAAASADEASGRRLTRVIVSGDALVQAQPDTAILSISVVTQGKRALEAQQQNANLSEAVVRAVKLAAGAGAEVKTSGYNLQPQRVYKENQPPTITGYEARNSVLVTMGDLTKVGAVIDAAAAAGANNVDSVAFTLRKDRPAKDQALADATREAIGKAQIIAQALGGRVARIVEVQEAGTFRPPQPVYDAVQMSEGFAKGRIASATPIEVGTLDIRSQVQLVAEIEAAR